MNGFWSSGFWLSGFWSYGFWHEPEVLDYAGPTIELFSPRRDRPFISPPRTAQFVRT